MYVSKVIKNDQQDVDLPLSHLLLELLGLGRVLGSHVLVALLQVGPVLHHLLITMMMR